MVAVAIMVSIVVSNVVPVSVVIVVAIMIYIAMALGRVGLVEVVSAVEASAPVAMATLEGHEHCGTVEEHPSDAVAGVDGEGCTGAGPDDGTVEPLTGHNDCE